jgi:hypothetical protein
MKKASLLAFCGAALLLSAPLAGCSGFADTLGLGRNAPDEFAVVDRPPLAMPPDFDLRPPKPGAARPQEVSQTDRASTMLFGANAKPSSAPSGAPAGSDAEKALLETSGAAKADPAIRETIDREAAQRVSGTGHLVDNLLWWKPDAPQGTIVDAPAEAARIRDAKEKGESPDQGATPIIERDKGGWLGL